MNLRTTEKQKVQRGMINTTQEHSIIQYKKQRRGDNFISGWVSDTLVANCSFTHSSFSLAQCENILGFLHVILRSSFWELFGVVINGGGVLPRSLTIIHILYQTELESIFLWATTTLPYIALYYRLTLFRANVGKTGVKYNCLNRGRPNPQQMSNF
jgi:hypothetical protein